MGAGPGAGATAPPLTAGAAASRGEDGVQASGLVELVAWFLGLAAFWTALFYVLTGTERRWAAFAPPSSKVHENSPHWAARNIVGIIHAVFISLITVPALFALAAAPASIQFAFSEDLAFCSMPAELRHEGWAWGVLGQGVAFAGLTFTAFTAADVVISIRHGLATPDFIAHHVAFITAGLIIRGHCMLPLNAAMLMAMEISTPFLNFMLFFRHRGEAYRSAVTATGVAFVLLFVVFRLGVNTYGAVLLLVRRDTAMPAKVPRWQAWFMLVAVTAGAAVQFFWFPAIARTFGRGLLDLRRRGRSGEEVSICTSSQGGSPASHAGERVELNPLDV